VKPWGHPGVAQARFCCRVSPFTRLDAFLTGLGVRELPWRSLTPNRRGLSLEFDATRKIGVSDFMSVYVYPTDLDWFRFLRARSPLDEVNFWQPGGSMEFRALRPGELFLFRLKSPVNKIAGGGVFAHASLFPISGAWEAFGEKNGVRSFEELFAAISRYRLRNGSSSATADTPIGCIVLESPFFLTDSEWISTPADYHLNLVQGKRFSAETNTGRLMAAWASKQLAMQRPLAVAAPTSPMYGGPTLVRPRLGQGGFRLLVSDAYEKRCAVTGERTLPVLEAAHIKPVASGGEHRIENGLLLRSDLHKLFDLGYATVTPTGEFRVSQKLKETWLNGRVYYELDKALVRRPARDEQHPSRAFLEWHNDVVFRG
jgi:putative restriction endonuclease